MVLREGKPVVERSLRLQIVQSSIVLKDRACIRLTLRTIEELSLTQQRESTQQINKSAPDSDRDGDPEQHVSDCWQPWPREICGEREKADRYCNTLDRHLEFA